MRSVIMPIGIWNSNSGGFPNAPCGVGELVMANWHRQRGTIRANGHWTRRFWLGVVGAIAATVTFPLTARSQPTDRWIEPCAERLGQRGILSGYLDGGYRLDRAVNRAEFASMVQAAFPNAPSIRNPINFVDIPTDFWAYEPIRRAYATGFVSGYPNGMFLPFREISRVQALVALVRGLDYEANAPVEAALEATLDDAAEIPDYAREAVVAAMENGLAVNYPDPQQLHPNRAITRGELAAFLCQASDRDRQLIGSNYVVRVPDSLPQPADSSPTVAEADPSPATPIDPVDAVDAEPIQLDRTLKTAQSDEVLAVLSDRQLRVVRQDNLAFDDAIAMAQGAVQTLRVRDLDGNGEPEILVDVKIDETGDRAGVYSIIYQYNPEDNNYTSSTHFWGTPGYEWVNFESDNIPEFKTFDLRFYGVFENPDNLRAPLQIWQYRQGEMQEVSQDYPRLVYQDAARFWQEANKRSLQQQPMQWALAGYLANKYRLDQAEEGWTFARSVYRKNDREEYFARVNRILTELGYGDYHDRTAATPVSMTSTAPPSAESRAAEPLAPIATLPSQTEPIRSIAIAPDGQTLVAGESGNIQIWNWQTGILIDTKTAHAGNVWSVAISGDGNTLASGSGDTSLKLWDLDTGELQRTLWHDGGWVNGVAIGPDGAIAISSSHDKGIKVWDADTGELRYRFDGSNPMAVSWETGLMAHAIGDRMVLRDLSDGDTVGTIAPPDAERQGIRAIAISPDGTRLASVVSGSPTIQIWNVETGELLRTLEGHTEMVETLAMSPNGTTLVSYGRDRAIRIWNLATGRQQRRIDGGSKAIAISPDGTLLASGGENNPVQLWRLEVDPAEGEL